MNKAVILSAAVTLPLLAGCQSNKSTNASKATNDVISTKNLNTDFNQIKDAYTKEAKDFKITEIELSKERVDSKKATVYKVKGIKDHKEQKVTLKANNLKKIRSSKETELDKQNNELDFNNVKISITDAISKAKEYSQVKMNPEEVELKISHNTPVYEVKFENKGQDIEVKLNATDGQQISVEKDD